MLLLDTTVLLGGEVVRVTAIGPTVSVGVQNCVWKFQYKIIGISKLGDIGLKLKKTGVLFGQFNRPDLQWH